MRVCVSSTSENLHNFRAAVVQQLGRLGHQVVSMEGYTADARCPVEKCLADVASAEAYIGLSVTEMEFSEASGRKLHRLIFLVPDDATWPMPDGLDEAGKGEERRDVLTCDCPGLPVFLP